MFPVTYLGHDDHSVDACSDSPALCELEEERFYFFSCSFTRILNLNLINRNLTDLVCPQLPRLKVNRGKVTGKFKTLLLGKTGPAVTVNFMHHQQGLLFNQYAVQVGLTALKTCIDPCAFLVSIIHYDPRQP